MQKGAYQKFISILGLVLVLSIGLTSITEPSQSVTANVVDEPAANIVGVSWPSFFFGLFIGIVAIGFVGFLVYFENKKEF